MRLHEATQGCMRVTELHEYTKGYMSCTELHDTTLEPHVTFCKPNVASCTSVQPHLTLCSLM